jgi:hypothetical protein
MGILLFAFPLLILPAWSCFALAIAIRAYLLQEGISLGVFEASMIGVVLLSIPAGGLIAGGVVHTALLGRRGDLAYLAAIMTAAWSFQSGALEEYLTVVLSLFAQAAQPVSPAAVMLSAVNRVIYVGALTGAMVVLVTTVLELPLRWAVLPRFSELLVPLDGVRPLLVVAVVAFALNLSISFFSHELRPAILLAVSR